MNNQLDTVTQDFRYAVRQLLGRPAFSVTAVLTLALSIGVIAAVFGVVRGVVLEPLSFPEADRLVRVTSSVPGVGEGEEWNLSTAQYFHIRERSSTIRNIGLWQITGLTIQTDDLSRRAVTAIVTADMMDLLGARPLHGRLLAEHDDTPGAARVAMLSYEYWKREFSGDVSVVGRTLQLQNDDFEVVGVMAPGIRLPGAAGAPRLVERPEIWTMQRLDPAGPYNNSHVFMSMGLLAEGASMAQAREELGMLTARLAEAFPEVYGDRFLSQFGLETKIVPLKAYQLGDMRQQLLLLFGAIAVVLLIALSNVANLFLARIEARHHEFALRNALGASAGAITRHVLMEITLLAVAGGTLAAVVAIIVLRLVVAGAPETLPRLENIDLDGGVLWFIAGVTLSASLGLTSLMMLRHKRSASLPGAGAETGRSTAGPASRQMRAGLVATQVALALVLLVAAGLLLQSFRKLNDIDPGFVADDVLRLQIHLSDDRYADHAAVWRFYSELLRRLEARPDVTSAGVGNPLPLSAEYGCWAQGFENAAVSERMRDLGGTECGDIVVTAPGYFETLGVPILDGRTFTNLDLNNPETGAVVVSKAFAERFWPGDEPLGKGVRPLVAPGDPASYYRVVGVVGDVPADSLEGARAMAVYYPMVPLPGEGFPISPALNLHLTVKTAGAPPSEIVSSIRAVLKELDNTLAVGPTGRMDDDISASMSQITFSMSLLAVAALFALFLAAVGVYGVLAYLVVRRTNEIGIRMALGAAQKRVTRLVLASSMKMVLAGFSAGIVAALLLTRLMHGMFFGIQPWDPAVYLAAAGILFAVSLCAAYLPARIATRVTPLEALRHH